jgi:predicted nuclease with TOPRIM domain
MPILYVSPPCRAWLSGNPTTVQKSLLVRAVEDFKERIVPMFIKVDTQKEEIEKLRDELRKLRRDKEHLQGKFKRMEPLSS